MLKILRTAVIDSEIFLPFSDSLYQSIAVHHFQKGAFVSEPAILVRRKHRSSQIWSMEKFENKIIDMRDMYEERKRLGVPIMVDDSDESESVCVVALHVYALVKKKNNKRKFFFFLCNILYSKVELAIHIPSTESCFC